MLISWGVYYIYIYVGAYCMYIYIYIYICVSYIRNMSVYGHRREILILLSIIVIVRASLGLASRLPVTWLGAPTPDQVLPNGCTTLSLSLEDFFWDRLYSSDVSNLIYTHCIRVIKIYLVSRLRSWQLILSCIDNNSDNDCSLCTVQVSNATYIYSIPQKIS